MGNAIPDFRF